MIDSRFFKSELLFLKTTSMRHSPSPDSLRFFAFFCIILSIASRSTDASLSNPAYTSAGREKPGTMSVRGLGMRMRLRNGSFFQNNNTNSQTLQ